MMIIGIRLEIIQLSAVIKKYDKYFYRFLVHTG